MAKGKQAVQTWQIWQVARKYLGVGKLAKMFGVTTRTIYDYASNPTTTEQKGCREPFERMHVFLTMLDDLGYGQYAKAGVDYLATAVEGGVCNGAVLEPLPTIMEEILCDYRAVALLQAAIDNGEPVEQVREKKVAAIKEIERTYLRYVTDHGDDGQNEVTRP